MKFELFHNLILEELFDITNTCILFLNHLTIFYFQIGNYHEYSDNFAVHFNIV